jgi:hypothetical protein
MPFVPTGNKASVTSQTHKATVAVSRQSPLFLMSLATSIAVARSSVCITQRGTSTILGDTHPKTTYGVVPWKALRTGRGGENELYVLLFVSNKYRDKVLNKIILSYQQGYGDPVSDTSEPIGRG